MEKKKDAEYCPLTEEVETRKAPLRVFESAPPPAALALAHLQLRRGLVLEQHRCPALRVAERPRVHCPAEKIAEDCYVR
jgi:hypothetical protein